MSLSDVSSRARVIATAAVAGVAVATTVAVSGSASADAPVARGPVEKAVTFTCAFPLVGDKQVPANVKITFPDSGTVGQSIQPTDFSVDVKIDADTTSALKLIGATTLEGDVATDVDIDLAGTAFGVTLNGLTIPTSPVADGGETPLTITGPIPGLTPSAAGDVSFAVGSKFGGKITPKTADGQPTELGTFDLACTMDEGQDAALATVPVS